MKELIDVVCNYCGKNSWEVNIAMSEGETRLILTCSNSECIEKARKELEGDPEDIIIFMDFNITGQGYDTSSPSSLN